MNQKLQNIFDLIKQSEKLDAEQKDKLLKAVKDADKELEITAFKLERTEKVKKTTAILLEETIEELEQKRKAVEEQNSELEIEASLERVRTVAMSMQKSEDLIGICEVSFKEFQRLGFDQIRNAIIHIPNDEQKYFMDYDFSELIGGAITKIKYGSHPIVDEYLKKIRSSEDAYFEVVIPEDQLNGWKDFRKNSGQIDDPRLDNAQELYYYLFSIGIGDIGISAFKPMSDSQINILKRFRNVFDLAYRRYTDITRAEAQAREAQIEAALERVRSRTMGMQKSNELKEVIQLVYEQFIHLNINIEHTGFILDYKAREDLHIWLADKHEIPSEITIPCFDSPPNNSIKEAKKNGEDSFTYLLTFEEKNNFYQELFKFILDVPEESLEYYFNCPGLAGSGVLLENIGLYIENFSGIPYTDEENKTLMRFGKVFQQTYTRFLDLQKAEAQTREAQIETALERVRSRTMGMQRSDELQDAAMLLFQQVIALGVPAFGSGFNIWDDDRKSATAWMAGQDRMQPPFKTSSSEDIFLRIYNSAQKGESLFVEEQSGEALKLHYDYMNSIPVFKEIADKMASVGQSFPTFQIMHCAFFSHGYLMFISFEPVPDAYDIFKRFAKVFEQTYTRFLDLQKAEAQAREAQIEAALERVRSKTMAMHKSEQLAETAKVLFEQFDLLGIYIDRMSIGIINEETNKAEFWLTDQVGNKLDNKYFFSLDEPTSMTKIYNAWQNGKDSIVVDLTGNELTSWLKFINENVKLPINVSIIKDRRVHQVAFFSSGFLMFTTSEPVNEEQVQLLVRFAKVFDLTYTRFQDLQKAEAQTRESEIQLALERVRARTLAMQNSEELVDAAAVVFQQLIHLGIEPNRIYIAIIKDLGGYADFWITDEEGSKVSSGFHPNLNDNISFKKMFEGWKNKEKSMTIDMQGEELNKYLAYLTKQNVPIKGGLSQKRRLQYIAYFSKGFIGVASPDETKPETLQLLERFAAVFNLTYTRFNDLLQAEAQNKIIQAENERKTKELEDARQLQLSMLPKEIPKLPHLDIAVYMKTATEVGGDYYDFNVDENGTLTFIVGDATGHGMMSGMMVSVMKSFFIANRKNIELKEFFESSNNSIKDMKLGRLMMALSAIQITSQKLIATNAGMPPLLYFRNKSQKAGEFVSHNFPLGAMNENKYALKEINYESGDIILMMSDGFAELRNENEEQYGYSRIKEEFRSVASKSTNEIVEHLKNSASEWINGIEPDDDVTFVVIKMT